MSMIQTSRHQAVSPRMSLARARRAAKSAGAGAVLFALCAVPAPLAAQESQTGDAANRAKIVQADEETRAASTARIDQTGVRNRADGNIGEASGFVFFDGTELSTAPEDAGIYQDGESSNSLIRQFGAANRAAIRQADSVGGGADASIVRILQGESGAKAEDSLVLVEQKGDGSNVTIEQNGRDNRSYAAQTGNLGPDAFDREAVEKARDAAEIPVSQGGNKQTQKLSGDGNESQIAQDGTGLEAEVSLLDARKDAGRISQSGAGHKASYSAKAGEGRLGEIVQKGPAGNNADADVTGADHRAEIRQDGEGGRSTASLVQAGSGHDAAIHQTGAQGGKSGNKASVDQAGDGNSGRVEQTESSANVADIGQEGEASSQLSATVRQSGPGGASKADIDQTGRAQSAIVEQSGDGGGSIAAIDQSTDGSHDNAARAVQEIDASTGTDEIDIDQGGNANRAKAHQTRREGGTGSVATLAQPGTKNNVTLRQNGQAHVANASQAGTANRADLSQKGSGGHKSDLDQNGKDNRGTIAQSGDGGTNKAAIDQSAADAKNNEAVIAQSGQRGLNTADIDQAQAGSHAEISQDGDRGGTGAKATISQPGRDNEASIAQDGPSLEASISQNGRGNDGAVVQAGEGAAGKAQISTGSGARDNRARIEQATGGNISSIDQTSSGNSAEIRAKNAAPQRASNKADIDQGGGGDNAARVRIGGDGVGRTVAVTQDATASRAEISLSGPSDTIKTVVQQTGRDNEIVVTASARNGGGLTSELQQDGEANTARATLDGKELKLKLKQDGSGHRVDVTLSGSGYSVTIEQIGSNQVFRRHFDGPAKGGGDYAIVQKP
ncbi:hypothetical protein [Aurantimonas sp. VKM B-3413]|uniref:hypothetical protein n=1 Tax=Aurantimonas sp. VKM B-3413 TaxID=2779401 RepID=UPI001E3AAEEB|nr:hypothetical protein [Aurantimonas sp. VKM B-3413]MCB8840180.1 hypothetical protein [Aurantimonas sp. VKM B-3413]